MAWLEAHEAEAQQIVRNANAWMQVILNQTIWEHDVGAVMRSALRLDLNRDVLGQGLAN